MYGIVSSLRKSEAIRSVDVTELVDEESVKLIKVTAHVVDGSLLYITELHTSQYQKYAYHWQRPNGEVIIRWDNKPHWKKLKTFPHHRHEGDVVLPSHRISIDEVIAAIEESFGREEAR